MSGRQLNRFKIKRPHHEIEFHEVLLDSLAQKKERELGLSEQKLEVLLPQRILQVIWLGFLALSLMLFGKTVQLQIFQGEALAQASENNQYAIRFIQAQRGVVYDKNMIQLVFNKPSFDLVVRPLDLPDDQPRREEIFKNIAQIIGQDYSELSRKIKASNLAEITVAGDLDYQTLILFEARSHEFSGFETKNNTAREYVSGPTFSHLIGYQRKTGEKKGLEEYYDDILAAQPGELRVKRDVFGNPLSKEVIAITSSGQSLVLYLDSELQRKLTETMEAVIKSVGAKGGAAVALDPKTGGVLAMVSFPTFDNNLFSQGMTQEEWNSINVNPQNPLFNRAISGIGYPTGSTIKPLMGLAALEEGVIKPDTQLYSPLEICVQNPWFPEKQDCYADWRYHGTSDLRRAIAESVNTFFYQIGGGYQKFIGLGATKIKKWLQAFNWGSKTGIDLPEEGEGILPNLEDDWRLGDTYHLSIGQGSFSITPLQVAAAYEAIANGGIIFQPQVVSEIIDSEKKIIQKIEPKILREISAGDDNFKVVREGMRQAVISPQGSSYLLSSLPVSAAAKTGTAQTGKADVYHNWVTVFAPYPDPQIVLTVVIENVPGVQVASLLVAQEVLNWYFSQ